MDENMVNNLKSESRWLRLVFMAFFALAAYVAAFLIGLLALVQALHGFIRGEPNGRLLGFTQGLNCYVYQIAQFLTYNSDDKPYPFADWPEDDQEGAVQEDVVQDSVAEEGENQ